MKIFLIVAALSGMLMPALATAELNYNTVDAGYSTTSYSRSSSHGTELDIGFANSISKNAYLRASFGMGSQTAGTTSGTSRVTSLSAGAGYHTPLMDKVDAIAQGNLVLGSSRRVGNTTSANGYDIGAGFRAMFRYGLECTFMVVHARLSNGVYTSTDNFISSRFGFNFTDGIQMYAGLDLKHDMTTRLGLRFFY